MFGTDGLSDKERDVWTSVVDRVKGEGADEHAAVIQANSAVREMRGQHYVSHPTHQGDVTITRFVVIDEEKGILAAMNGNTEVEYFFDRRSPHDWDEQNARDWYGKKYGGITCMADVAVRVDDAQLPEKVKSTRENLLAAGKQDPFIRRISLKTGNFTVGGSIKKVKMTQAFYDRFGPEYENKPIYKGHQGFGDTDHRPVIGRILAYQNIGNNPHFWIYLYDEETITAIRENEALGIEDDDDTPFGQFSIEAIVTKAVKHEDGYSEPMELYRKFKGMALVNRAGATGTRVEKIAAKEEEHAMSGNDTKTISEATLDELMAHEKFGEAFAAYAEKMAGEDFKEGNPVVNILVHLAKNHREKTNELIAKLDEAVVGYLSQDDIRKGILASATAEEIGTLAGFSEAIKALTADQVKEIPGFAEAVKAMGQEEWEKVPAFKEALAAKEGDFSPSRQAVEIAGGIIKNFLGSDGKLTLGASDGLTEEEKEKKAREDRLAMIDENSKTVEGIAAMKEEDILEGIKEGLIKI
jgi:hypothetical protein